MSVAAVGIIAILTLAAAIAICYIGEGQAHPELEDHDWYRN